MFQVIKIRKLLFFIFLFFILFSSFNICFSYELSNDYGDCNFDSIIGTDTDVTFLFPFNIDICSVLGYFLSSYISDDSFINYL